MASSLQVIEVFLRHLDGPGPLQIETVRGHTLNGLFHTQLGRLDTAFDRRLHTSKDPAPFSLSPISDPKRGEFHGIRLGFLTNEIADKATEVWTRLWRSGEEFLLGQTRMCVQDVRVPNYPRPTDYSTLLAAAPAAHGVWMEFAMPTRLSSQPQGSVLPTPGAIWGFFAKKWVAHSGGVELPWEFLHWVRREAYATEAYLDIGTVLLEGDVEWKGVMGRVEYQAMAGNRRSADFPVADYLRAWQALAFLAEYCGTGVKTTMGMGRTRRVKVFSRHADG